MSQGREFNLINPLVDVYNSVSLSYAVLCGGEDLAKIVGDLCLGRDQGNESFFPLGAESDASALADEISVVEPTQPLRLARKSKDN